MSSTELINFFFQKRIVDDILTLSKLDSALLVVTPVSVQPVSSSHSSCDCSKLINLGCRGPASSEDVRRRVGY